MYKLTINTTEFNCFDYRLYTGEGSYFYAVIPDQDYTKAKKEVEKITKIVITTDTNEKLLETSDFDTYSTITFQDKFTHPEYFMDGTEAQDTFAIYFKRKNIEARINELTEIVKPTVDEEAMALDEFKLYYKGNLSKQCKDTIYAGKNVTTEYGDEYFTYKDEDQRDLDTLFFVVAFTGLSNYYHPSTNPTTPCRLYKATDIAKIYSTLKLNLMYHSTYANQLYTMVDKCISKEEIREITYGMELPTDLSKNVDEVMKNSQEVIDAMMKNIASTLSA